MSRSKLNMRHWPRSSQVYRPTQILPTVHSIAVLTTAAASAPTVTAHSLPVAVLVPVAVHPTTRSDTHYASVVVSVGVVPRAAVAHNVSYNTATYVAVRATAATGKAALSPVQIPVGVFSAVGVTHALAFSVHTTVGASADVGPGIIFVPLLDENGDPILDENGVPIYVSVMTNGPISVLLLDENGDPILDENGDPIYVSVPNDLGGSWKDALVSSIVTGGASTVGTIVFLGVAVAVLTTASVAVLVPIVKATPGASTVTGAAASGAPTAHSAPTASVATAAGAAPAGVAHSAPTGSNVAVGAHSAATAVRAALIASLTTGGVWVWTSIDDLAHTIAVLTTGAGGTFLISMKAADIATGATSAASTLAPTTKSQATTPTATTAAAGTSAGGLRHDVTVEALTSAAAQAASASFRAAIVAALTTGAAYTQLGVPPNVMCVDVTVAFDTVDLSVAFDEVDVDLVECD